jgi:hypothetical protein
MWGRLWSVLGRAIASLRLGSSGGIGVTGFEVVVRLFISWFSIFCASGF